MVYGFGHNCFRNNWMDDRIYYSYVANHSIFQNIESIIQMKNLLIIIVGVLLFYAVFGPDKK